MKSQKLYIAMVGLPARGKSTIARKLKEHLSKDTIKTKIFNNGDLRRKLTKKSTSHPEFYDSANTQGVALREKIAHINCQNAKKYLNTNGNVAILDATNCSYQRRKKLIQELTDYPILFIECINDNKEILKASIQRKTLMPEFKHLKQDAAIKGFEQRIDYYKQIYNPLKEEQNFVRLDSLNNRIIEEEISNGIPYYDRIRDFLVSDAVKDLYLIRHGETYFNLENRIGGDSDLTINGISQSRALAKYFTSKKIPIIFTSEKKRTIQTANPIRKLQENSLIIPLSEFDEIDSGVCECMTYNEIRAKMPQVYLNRKKDKYNYLYPEGEGYVSMKKRINHGIKKALYLSGYPQTIMIIGHQAVNRMILSHFLFRREEDVPYTYIPQDKFYHVVATPNKKLFQLIKYDSQS